MKFHDAANLITTNQVRLSDLEKYTTETPKMTKKNIIEKEKIPIPEYRVLVVTHSLLDNEYCNTVNRIVEECKKMNIPYYVLELETAMFKNVNGIKMVHNLDDVKGFEINPKNTIAIIRGSVIQKYGWLDVVSQLEQADICCVNSRNIIEICSDKYRTYLQLLEFKVKQPKTILLQGEKSIEPALQYIGNFPIIIKTLRGSKGIGVIFVESRTALDGILQLIWKLNPDQDLLMQEYIETDKDIRVLLLNGKVQDCMSREVIQDDFRSNFSRGAKVKKYQLSEVEILEVEKAARAIGNLCSWLAVDFIPSKNKKESPYIIEANNSPGTEGLESAVKKNIVREMIEFFKDTNHRKPVPREIGIRETINIIGVGNVVCKFDTGNTVDNTIHADFWDINNKTVTWVSNKRKFTNKLVEIKTAIRGGLKPIKSEYPIILLDVEFLGITYKNIRFALDDRNSKHTGCLICKDFMRLVNVMINPAGNFLKTNKLDSYDIITNKEAEK